MPREQRNLLDTEPNHNNIDHHLFSIVHDCGIDENQDVNCVTELRYCQRGLGKDGTVLLVML